MEAPMPGGVGNIREISDNNSDNDRKTNGEEAQRRLLQRENSNNQIHNDPHGAETASTSSTSASTSNNTPAPLSVVMPFVVPLRRVRSSSGRPSNTTLPSLGDATNSSWTSSTAAANNFVHSFDDQGKAASYLQFFRSTSKATVTTTTTTTSETSGNYNNDNKNIATIPMRSPQLHLQPPPQQQHFPFDVYSTDRTTRTPFVVPAAGKQQQQEIPKLTPTASSSTSSHGLLDYPRMLTQKDRVGEEEDETSQEESSSSSSVSASSSSHSSSSSLASSLSSFVQHHPSHPDMRSVGTNSVNDNQGRIDMKNDKVLAKVVPPRVPPTQILYQQDRRTSPTMMVPDFLSPMSSSSSCSLYDDTNVPLDRASLEPVRLARTKVSRTTRTLDDTTTTSHKKCVADPADSEDDSEKDNDTVVCLERQCSFNSTTTSSTSRSVRFHPSTKMATLPSMVHKNNKNHPRPTTKVPSSLLGKSNSDQEENDDDDDSISILSSRSHLFGESISVSHPCVLQSSNSQTTSNQSSLHSNPLLVRPTRPSVTSMTGSSPSDQSRSASLSPQQQPTWWSNSWNRLRNECQNRLPLAVKEMGAAHRLTMLPLHRKAMPQNHPRHQSRHHPMPLSPRSRNLADLQYLTQQHKQKVQQITYQDEQHFDFVLVLQPQEVYGFWAALLDFRVELLGEEVVQAMEEHWRSGGSNSNTLLSDQPSSSEEFQCPTTLTKDNGSRTESDASSSCGTIFDENENEENTTTLVVVAGMDTPTTGVRRRRNINNKNDMEDDVVTPLLLTTPAARYSSSRRLLGMSSPGLYSVGGAAAGSIVGDSSLFTGGTHTQQPPKKQSMFERALTTPLDNEEEEDDEFDDSTGRVPESDKRGDTGTVLSKAMAATNTPATVGTMYKRRWGNQQVQRNSSHRNSCMLSPPITSLKPRQRSSRKLGSVKPMQRTLPNALTLESNENKDNNPANKSDPHIMTEQDIPNQIIARGIAARTNRTNGMLPFLSVLKRGIVLRRHRPNQEATFCKLTSPDGGDTIVYQTVDASEAILAFREQRVRFNHDVVEAQPWSLEPPTDATGYEENAPHNFSVPDYVAADAYRKRQAAKGKLLPAGQRLVSDWANKVAAHSKVGSAKMADVLAVHPARNKDPRAESSSALGSTTLRRSQSEYATNLTFSLVVRATKNRLKKHGNDNIEDLENKWHEGDGNETQFRYLDWEVATEGEYWLVFRGLLLLHRDAAVGRFSKQRAAGIGTNVDNMLRTLENAEHTRLHQDEFHEPVTVGWLEKKIVNCRDIDTTYMEGFVTKDGAVPPPSDYFLGFRSPGTTIWSRLRQAGLETRRVYSLDPNRVMIKIHCPYDRLMDVAEVLRIPVKTRDGSFTPFREDLMHVFERCPDPLEGPTDDNPFYPDFQFRSSIRQNIISFIIGSRIRDSGAELDPTGADELGQMVQARVPLHTHGKLNAIFESWFYFWKAENWDHCGHQLRHNDQLTVNYGAAAISDEHIEKKISKDVPGLFTRIFAGCMNQPLDSIEQYFGEKVAFYFTWLQHTASHLVFLSVVGLFVFICQLSSGNVDHPIRPFFSIVVMLWTFVVLINWKKRANFMAYRWGTLNYKEQETTRPQFKGNYMQDEITREWIVTYPKWRRWLKYCISFPITLLFTGGTLTLILWVHGNRDAQLHNYFTAEDSEKFELNFAITAIGQSKQMVDVKLTKDILLDMEFWIIMVGLPSALGLCLPLLNFVLMRLSILLNDFENYRTESEYRTYLIIKVFSFRFICYFATLYYYAFVSVGSDDLAIQNGLIRVGTGVLVCTTVAQWWQSILHVCFPILIRKIRMHYRRQRLTNELRIIELEEEDINRLSMQRVDNSVMEQQARLINKRLLLDQAQDDIWLELMNPPHDSFSEYIQAVVQFAFVACFSVVLPITPLIVLFNYLISMRLDAYKLCRGRRRPLAEKTGGIGVWEHVLHIVAVISVLTNCCMMGFTSSLFIWIGEKIGELGLFALIVGWEHVMLLIKYVMSTSMSPLPKSVRDAMKREQYELDKQRNTLMQERRQQHFDDEDGMGSSIRLANRKSVSPSFNGSMRFRSKFDKAVADEDNESTFSCRSARSLRATQI